MRVPRAFLFAVIVLFAAGMGSESTLRAETTCSTETLNGAYSYLLRGSFIGDAFGDVFDFSAAGRLIADGSGSFSGTETTSEAQQITRGQKYTGTYTVNDDCTGTATFRDSAGKVFANYDLVITNNSKDVEMIEADQGTNISGTARQQFSAQ